MSKALLAQLAFLAAASACASTQHAQRADVTPSQPAGQAAQPNSWVAQAPGSREVQIHSAPAGQAAEPQSWPTAKSSETFAPLPLAQDGPSYLGGRAGQPSGWGSPVAKRDATRTVASAPATSRQH